MAPRDLLDTDDICESCGGNLLYVEIVDKDVDIHYYECPECGSQYDDYGNELD